MERRYIARSPCGCIAYVANRSSTDLTNFFKLMKRLGLIVEHLPKEEIEIEMFILGSHGTKFK